MKDFMHIMRTTSNSQNGIISLINKIYYTCHKPLIGIEIGSYAGESAELMCSTNKILNLICIDPWINDENGDNKNSYNNMDQIEIAFDNRASKIPQIIKFKGTLESFIHSELYKQFENKIDFVYIDGLHTYSGCKSDIELTNNIIKPNIAISGHDYADKPDHILGVKKSVNEFFNKPDFIFSDTSWLYFYDRKYAIKTALVCIAKFEDNYINEWISYHTKLGFDDIYIYQNDWQCKINKSQHLNVKWMNVSGKGQQINTYNTFIQQKYLLYDFAAFFDVDEFLSLKKFNNVKPFLYQFINNQAIGINWRLFGDNGLQNVVNNDYSVVNRFIHCDKNMNQHIKTIINFSKCKNIIKTVKFRDPHSLQNSMNDKFTISSNGEIYIHGPFNKQYIDDTQLNHYYCKTLSEFKQNKCIRCGGQNINRVYTQDEFNAHNKNDIEDLTAKKFYNL